MENEIALVGLDIAKNVFQVHGADRDGRAVLRRKLKRDQVEQFFAALAPCQVGFEACPGSHHWARVLRRLGHQVRLLPAQFVRPYVKSNKNDAADAEDLRGHDPAHHALRSGEVGRTVAVANKTARIVWALLRHGGTYEAPMALAA